METLIGDIRIVDKLPRIFTDHEVRAEAATSLDRFRNTHDGQLPLKYRLAEFTFNRRNQVCYADAPEKLLAWDGKDIQLAAKILGAVTEEDLSLVLRSHPMEDALKTPTFTITSLEEIRDLQRHLVDPTHPSAIWNNFFALIEREYGLDNTIVQLLKNITEQKGLFLIRPIFIYDPELRTEIAGFTSNQPFTPTRPADIVDLSEIAPEAFVGFRVLPLGAHTREKKDRLGAVFIYNPETKKFEARSGIVCPPEGTVALGRHIDFEQGNRTRIEYWSGSIEQGHLVQNFDQDDRLFLLPSDIPYLRGVMPWQLPRIFAFEEEIRQQEWIDQGFANIHQFVAFPLRSNIPGDWKVNTQYFDFRPHPSRKEMTQLAIKEGRKFDKMTPEEKIKMFF